MKELQYYFPNLTEIQLEQFSKLKDLYEDWNEKINVISRKDTEELYIRHVLHSLGIAKVMMFSSGSKVLDVGTGGGFPGIPLAILFPEVEFHLVDSIQKKILVVSEIANALNLKNVKAETQRVEKLKSKYDFIVSRAVTQMPKFVNWVRNKIKKEHKNPLPNGILYLKGGDLTDELKDFPTAIEYPLSNYFSESFFETKKVVYLAL
ncbi:MAG: 16S rRNA (guanine(527)-N(7))-methyltransferase RsmG [Weeksellaceae bacterium]|jgi:16S rRNA (guanine527-N7)-methyltransferase|nr:16S rRNA (guanine(527)-N(7))-methyltransferase RsmG [Weeksellaceae bacterium]